MAFVTSPDISSKAERTLAIVRALQYAAERGSYALPQGRGGKAHSSRLDSYRLWAAEAEQLLAELVTQAQRGERGGDEQ